MSSLPIFPSNDSRLLGTTEHPWDEVHAKKYYDEEGNELLNNANLKNRLRPGLARNKTYAVGDICFHDSLPSYAYLECITAGTTAETEQDFGGQSPT